MKVSYWLQFIKEAVLEVISTWLKKDIPFKSAGLTYYALFATVPLLSLLITLSTILVSENFIAGEINDYIGILFDDPIRSRLQNFVLGLIGSDYSIALSIGGLVALLYAVTAYFGRLNQMVIEVASDDEVVVDVIENLRQRIKGVLYAVFIFFFISIASLAQRLVSNLDEILPNLLGSRITYQVFELLGQLIAVLLLALLLAVYYRSILHHIATRESFIITGLLGSLAVTVVNYGFSYALGFSAQYQDYGIFSAMLSVVIWVFVINVILLVVARLAATNYNFGSK